MRSKLAVKAETEADQKNQREVKATIILTRSILTMFSSGIKVQNYRKLLQMTETSPSGLRNDALGLDLRVQRKLYLLETLMHIHTVRQFQF